MAFLCVRCGERAVEFAARYPVSGYDAYLCHACGVEYQQLFWSFSTEAIDRIQRLPRLRKETLPVHLFRCTSCGRILQLHALGEVMQGPACPICRTVMREFRTRQMSSPLHIGGRSRQTPASTRHVGGSRRHD